LASTLVLNQDYELRIVLTGRLFYYKLMLKFGTLSLSLNAKNDNSVWEIAFLQHHFSISKSLVHMNHPLLTFSALIFNLIKPATERQY